jgi:hypothetical protein
MSDSESPSTDPSQFLGYATPNTQRKRASIWLPLACFIWAFVFTVLTTAFMVGWRLDLASVIDLFVRTPYPVGANSVGFVAGFLIFRPCTDVQKWRVHLMAVAAGALAFLIEESVFAARVKLKILNSELILPICFCSGLIATCVLFWLYRVAFERRVSGRSRIDG